MGLRRALRWLEGSILLLPAVLLTACGQSQEVVVEPPLPKASQAQAGAVGPPEGASLAPLATRQQVLQAVDVGRRDPFAAVLTPRLVKDPAAQLQPAAARGVQNSQSLGVPKGLVFQGVLQGPLGREALVEYAPPEAKEGGPRSGSLRVGDVGTGAPDSLLPPGWRVGAIDVSQGRLVLQAGQQAVILGL